MRPLGAGLRPARRAVSSRLAGATWRGGRYSVRAGATLWLPHDAQRAP